MDPGMKFEKGLIDYQKINNTNIIKNLLTGGTHGQVTSLDSKIVYGLTNLSVISCEVYF